VALVTTLAVVHRR